MTVTQSSDVLADLPRHGVGAVVLGGDHQGLGVVRSLGRRGVPVVVVDDELSISRASRWTTTTLRADLSDAGSLVPYLIEAADRRRLHGWVLFPTRDETVAILSQHRDRLAEVFRVPTPPWAVASIALDKRLTYQEADRLGIPVPRTWRVPCGDAVDIVDGDPPYVIKPAIKSEFVRVTHVKAWRADTRAQLRDLVERAGRIVPTDEVLVQELVPGDGQQQLSYCALVADGRVLASMSVQRRRQHPHEFGRATTFATTVDEPRVEGHSERLLSAMGHHGLVEVEFKHDVRDGRTKLLDVNARTWGHHTLGAAAGVDFPALLFAQQLGREFPRPSAVTGVSWVRLVTDLPTGVAAVLGGRLRPMEYLRSFAGGVTGSVFAWDDPGPALAELVLMPYLISKRGV